MDDWIEILIYVIALSLGGLSQLFKALRGRLKGAGPEPGRVGFPFEQTAAQSQDASPARLEALHSRAGELLERGRDLERKIRLHGGGAVLAEDSLADDVLEPLSGIEAELSSAPPRPGALTEDDAAALENRIAVCAAVLEMLEGLVQQRTGPANAALLDNLDRACQALLEPFVVHARSRRIPYPTRHGAVSVVADGGVSSAVLSEAALAFVFVEPKLAGVPVGWMALPRDVMRDVLVSTPRLASSVQSAARARHLADFQFVQVAENQAISGLVARWVPGLFCDAGACLMLGPAYAAGVRSEIELQRLSAEDCVAARLGNHEQLLEPPAHVRMMVAARTMQHLGMADEAKRRWKQWNNKVGAPTRFVLTLPDGRTRELSFGLVQNAVLASVDAMLTTPLGPLSGTALREIRGVPLRPEDHERMLELRDLLLEGEAQREPPRVVLGAALLAVEKSPTREGRVGRAALKCLDASAVERPRAAVGGRPLAEESLREMVRSPGRIAEAFVLGATLSPRPDAHARWGRRSRRRLTGPMM